MGLNLPGIPNPFFKKSPDDGEIGVYSGSEFEPRKYKYALCGGNASSATPAGEAKYYPISGVAAGTTNESAVNVLAPATGTLKNFRVWCGANTLNGDCVIQLRTNSGSTGLTVTYSAAQTGSKTDTIHTANTISTSNWLYVQVDASEAATGTINNLTFGVDIEGNL